MIYYKKFKSRSNIHPMILGEIKHHKIVKFINKKIPCILHGSKPSNINKAKLIQPSYKPKSSGCHLTKISKMMQS